MAALRARRLALRLTVVDDLAVPVVLVGDDGVGGAAATEIHLPMGLFDPAEDLLAVLGVGELELCEEFVDGGGITRSSSSL